MGLWNLCTLLCVQAKPVPAVVSVMQCALILLAPIEPLFTHAGHVYVDPALAAGAKAKAALATMHIDSDSDSEADTVCAASPPVCLFLRGV